MIPCTFAGGFWFEAGRFGFALVVAFCVAVFMGLFFWFYRKKS